MRHVPNAETTICFPGHAERSHDSIHSNEWGGHIAGIEVSDALG